MMTTMTMTTIPNGKMNGWIVDEEVRSFLEEMSSLPLPGHHV